MSARPEVQKWHDTNEIREYHRSYFFSRTGMPLHVHMTSGREPDRLRHKHDFTELVVILNGSGLHLTGPEPYRIQAGDIFVVPEGTIHAYQDASLHYVNVLFDLDELDLPVRDLTALEGYQALFVLEPQVRSAGGAHHHCRLSPEDLAIVRKLLASLIHELDDKPTGYRSMATGLFLQVVAFLSRCYSNIHEPEPRALLRLGQALNYIEDHHTEQITLDSLATNVGMSPSTLQRSFQLSLETSPIDYLIGLRIQKSLPLLTDTALNITEIAFRVGFTDSNYFARQFRKRMGVSPREYRRQALECGSKTSQLF